MSPSSSNRPAQDLILAAVQGDLGRLQELLRAGVSVDAADSMGRTALILAAYYGQREVIDILIAAGAALDFRCLGDERDRRPLAAWEARAVEEKVPDEAGQTALCEAARSTMIDEGISAEVLRRLLSAGADPKIPDVQGRTPLHQAAWRERPEAVRALLAGGAAVDARDRYGYTPLMYVPAAGHSSAGAGVFLLLRQAGADETGREQVDLVWAAGEPDPEGVRSALERGADVNFITKNGDTALLWAVVARSKAPEAARNVVAILLEKGADPDLCTPGRGIPPLFPAIEHGDLEMVEILLQHGADPALPWRGATPLKYAKAYRQTAIVALLTELA